ncbi:MAG TPA: hypothetical protein DDZ96_04140 [Porphyromonadaceae bacterium]|jgi:mRNA-degrading endonuclease RelE of RelBE toxin-antitoxin system|uniref:type II toxin-antitoxin system RelE/ParE family toxin n=1 Tax=Limibacterium fermenti TaxID=3229863 RepID=UPI000E8468F4|nr:hypothetical protein [Porphyromonadaceae bacterium]HBL32995.1 hypothetical protein [Porphyromonadaceae bacterium]HBX21994.1 hypothetical protein [Porphyromonadaceae bacterium]HBX44571.1 hypothetical protein [Porphyromonadaceae bacterium]
MNYSFEITDDFAKELKALAKKYASIRSDILKLQQSIIENPEQGIELGGGFRKIRFSISSKNKGKRSGGRVITYEIIFNTENEKIIFVAIYDKSEYVSIDLNLIRKSLGL